ncbi:hypothetical protein C8F04DRAFT_1177088 [Mycena alexandri]|uniref:Uncharacterized protein n=1 Tax=Mycena alexandri TaxID=1745969 RepID=A0AAD6XDU6_9AGAR|nr:hypothetical protein C8F04DRAFT_1177088 [Mycena alexandri]
MRPTQRRRLSKIEVVGIFSGAFGHLHMGSYPSAINYNCPISYRLAGLPATSPKAGDRADDPTPRRWSFTKVRNFYQRLACHSVGLGRKQQEHKIPGIWRRPFYPGRLCFPLTSIMIFSKVFGTSSSKQSVLSLPAGPSDFDVLEAQRAAKRARKEAAAPAT